MKCFARLLILMVLLKVVDEIHCVCLLSLKTDFGSPSPVFLHGGEFLAPNTKNGSVLLRRAEVVTVSCPGRRVVLGNDTSTSETVEAKCVSNTTFSVGKWRGPFKDVRCDVQPSFTVTETKTPCYRGGQKTVKVGYTVSGNFHQLYTACFDRALLSTLYVRHELAPSSSYGQSGRRPQFTGGDLFGKFNIANLYKQKYQKERINTVLGPGMDQTYLSKNQVTFVPLVHSNSMVNLQFLTRGHLAANADFSLRAQQRASFHFVNAAPQWLRGNAGDWAALEDGVRRRVHKSNASVTVYTGTHGVLALPGARGTRELFLHTDGNNNEAVPVPLYFYKLVHDERRKTATAFVLINSTFFNKTTTDQLTFCDDVCADVPWVKWRNDATHSFCCSYEDFVESIDHIVGLDVDGLYK